MKTELELIGMKTGEGKTLLAMKNALESASKGVSTLLISTEETAESITRRYRKQLDVKNLEGLPLYHIHAGTFKIDKIIELYKKNILKNKIEFLIIDHLREHDEMSEKLLSELGVKVLAYYQKPRV